MKGWDAWSNAADARAIQQAITNERYHHKSFDEPLPDRVVSTLRRMYEPYTLKLVELLRRFPFNVYDMTSLNDELFSGYSSLAKKGLIKPS